MKNRISINGQTRISEWYMGAFPTDELGKDINKPITFQDIYEQLYVGGSVYALLGVEDSIVRERVFAKLAELMGVDYDYVYNQWLSAENPCEMRLYEDMTTLRF
jgi:hypothetical protein